MDADEERQEIDRGASGDDDYRREVLRYQAHRHATNAALVSGVLALVAIGGALTATSVLSGVELLAAFGILGVVVIAFYAFVFGRALRLRAEGSREKAGIDLEIGKRS